MDRLVTIYRACKRAKRTVVIDLYAATIAAATGRRTIPQPGFPRLQVYIPLRQRSLVKESGEFERVNALSGYRIYLDEIRERAGELIMVIQGSTLRELARERCLEDATAIWSLWPGYLDRSLGKRTARLLEEHGVPLVHLRSSGHAPVEDLRALAGAIAPTRVVPIHTSAPEQFTSHFESRGSRRWRVVECLESGLHGLGSGSVWRLWLAYPMSFSTSGQAGGSRWRASRGDGLLTRK